MELPDKYEAARRREVGLGLSVSFYGMANHSPSNIPARPDLVMKTAAEFVQFLDGVPPTDISAARTH